LTVRSRTLKTLPDVPDGPVSDMSCGYQNVLLRWLVGDFTRPAKHQQSVAARVDVPPHVDSDDNITRGVDGRLPDHDAITGSDDDGMTRGAVETVSAEERNGTLVAEFTAGQSVSVVATTKLGVTYTAAAEVISVLE